MPVRRSRVCGCGHGEEHHTLHGGKASGACQYGTGTPFGKCECGAFHRRSPKSNGASVPTLRDPHAAALNALRDTKLALRDAQHAVERALVALTQAAPKLRAVPDYDFEDEPIPAPPPKHPRPAMRTRDGLMKGEQRILIAIAQHPKGVTREQLTVLTGYRKTSRDTYLGRLHRRGLVVGAIDSARHLVTREGLATLGDDFEPLPKGAALRDHWLEKLPAGECVILSALVAAYPDPLEIASLEAAVGYKKTSRDTYLRKLMARELVDKVRPGVVVASPMLFEDP